MPRIRARRLALANCGNASTDDAPETEATLYTAIRKRMPATSLTTMRPKAAACIEPTSSSASRIKLRNARHIAVSVALAQTVVLDGTDAPASQRVREHLRHSRMQWKWPHRGTDRATCRQTTQIGEFLGLLFSARGRICNMFEHAGHLAHTLGWVAPPQQLGAQQDGGERVAHAMHCRVCQLVQGRIGSVSPRRPGARHPSEHIFPSGWPPHCWNG